MKDKLSVMRVCISLRVYLLLLSPISNVPHCHRNNDLRCDKQITFTETEKKIQVNIIDNINVCQCLI